MLINLFHIAARMKNIIAVILFIAMGFLSASAQDGRLSGKVWDSEKEKPLPLAIVSVYQKGRIVMGTATDANGRYNISVLSPGNYRLTISYPGYTTKYVDSIAVFPLKTTFADFDMAVGKPRDKRGRLSLAESYPQKNIPNRKFEHVRSGKIKPEENE